MNKSKITIEYNVELKQKSVKKNIKSPNRGGRSYEHVLVDVKEPRCWEIITVENTLSFTPGQRLTKKQVQGLCSGAGYDVEIGLPGQFRVSNSRY